MARPALGWAVLGLVILAIIVVPFLLLESELSVAARAFLDRRPPWWGAAPAIAGLLAADIVLPIPSSFVSTSSGILLGFAGGAATSWLGMTAGCLLAYWLGERAGRPGAKRIVGAADLARAESAAERWGAAAVVVLRSIPVMAEASVVLAGVLRMEKSRFILLVGFSNAGISLVYAATGAFAARVDAFALAFAGAVALPGLAMIVLRTFGLSQKR